MGALHIGTAGWSYPNEPGSWTGVVYPARQGSRWRGRRFDELAYYAERFDTVEVNSSFYRVPPPEMTASWARRTPPGFVFSVKLFQKLTHPRMFLDRIARPPAGEEPEGTGLRLSHGEALLAAGITQGDVDEVRASLDPLARAGKLGALLAQFPPAFKADRFSIEYLGWLLDAFGDYEVAVELRHRSWSDDAGTTLRLLDAARAAWVQIDEPKFRFSIRQNFLPNVEGFYYLRLHGRNAGKWWSHDTAAERYDYLYSEAELDPFVEVAEAVRTLVKKMYLYTNNHFAGKAVANALMLRHRLGLETAADYPSAFVERYPETAGLVSAEPHEAPAAAPRGRTLF